MNLKYILAFILILLVVINELHKYFKYKKLVGKRVTVNYSECASCSVQNINGYILKKIKIGSGTHFIVKLDTPIHFNEKTEEVVIIKEKGDSKPIGTNRLIEIHLYLPLVSLSNNKFSLLDFEHIGWATVKPENSTV